MMKAGLSGGGGASSINNLISNNKNLSPWAIAGGFVTGAFHVLKFFKNEAVGTTFEMVSSFGGTSYPYDELTVGTDTMELVSSDANDTLAGTGARKVRIFGLDANFDLYDAEYNLNGTTDVQIPAGTFKRVYRAFVTEAGTYGTNKSTGANVGAITLRMTTSGTTVLEIPAREGQTLMCQYTIPAGHTGFMTHAEMHIQDNKIVNVEIVNRQGADLTAAPYEAPRVKLALDGNQSVREMQLEGAFSIPEKTDIWIEAKAASTTALVDGYYEIFVLNNSTFTLY